MGESREQGGGWVGWGGVLQVEGIEAIAEVLADGAAEQRQRGGEQAGSDFLEHDGVLVTVLAVAAAVDDLAFGGDCDEEWDAEETDAGGNGGGIDPTDGKASGCDALEIGGGFGELGLGAGDDENLLGDVP
jgi:hypothetical protein